MAWTQQANLTGPPGPPGDPGLPGKQGPPGDPGKDGRGVEIAGQVATYGDLPRDLAPTDSGKGFLVESDGLLYVFTGEAFPPEGKGASFRGPVGPPGIRGSVWFTGSGAPTTVAHSRVGDMYLDIDDGTVYQLG